MLKKTIAYTDFNDEKQVKTFYFNLTKAEIVQWQLSRVGGLDAWLDKVLSTKDEPGLSELFKDLILKSYGEKSPDGQRFVKTQELRDGFEQTNAFSELYMELATKTESAVAFFNGLIPPDLLKTIQEQIKKDGTNS